MAAEDGSGEAGGGEEAPPPPPPRLPSRQGGEEARTASDPTAWMPNVLRVPQDCPTVEEAVKRAKHGQTVHIAAGEHRWNGRIDVDKVMHIEGERDPLNNAPLTVLIGRWKLCAPPPTKWDMNPNVTGTMRDVQCEAEGGYCCQIVGVHWEMTNARFSCKGGTAAFVHDGTVAFDGCWLGGSKDTRLCNNGLVVCNDARVFLNKTAMRNCKAGIYLRDSGALFMVESELHRVAIAFGCMLPNTCEMEVAKTRMHEVEEVWSENSRPEKLLQQGNYDVYGTPIHLHGDADGSHTFQTQDLMSTAH